MPTSLVGLLGLRYMFIGYYCGGWVIVKYPNSLDELISIYI